jgi:hypothetical protein
MTKGQIEHAVFRARRLFEDWNDVTGCFTKHTSYYYEILAVIEDAVHCGAQEALWVYEPLEAEKQTDYVGSLVKGVRFGTESCAGEKVTTPAKSIAEVDTYLNFEIETKAGKPEVNPFLAELLGPAKYAEIAEIKFKSDRTCETL